MDAAFCVTIPSLSRRESFFFRPYLAARRSEDRLFASIRCGDAATSPGSVPSPGIDTFVDHFENQAAPGYQGPKTHKTHPPGLPEIRSAATGTLQILSSDDLL